MHEKTMLSKYFSFGEMTATAKHPELLAENRIYAEKFIRPMKSLCVDLLDPMRERFGAIIVPSGVRCPALNSVVGGVATSQHVRGEAADIVFVHASLDEGFDWARKNLGGIFGQLIREPNWLHISVGQPYRALELCGQVLTYDGKIYRRIG